jgi:1,4-dihydroxy-2-naphthoate octaprenyltransferase
VANLLFINQFPDVNADAIAGKRNLVVRLEPQRARWLYPLILGAASLWLAAMVVAGALPALAVIALVSVIPGMKATVVLLRHAREPQALDPAIRATIGAALLHGAALAGVLFAT